MYTMLFILALLSAVTGYPEGKWRNCEVKTIHCSCGTGENRLELLLDLNTNMMAVGYPFTLECPEIQDQYQACANYNCTLEGYSQPRPAGKPGDAEEQSGSSVKIIYPQEFFIPLGDLRKGQRSIRETDPCEVTPMEHGTIKCWKWPHWITCDVNCTYAYAIQGPDEAKQSINVNCKLSENVWNPIDFPICQPYLNCDAHLVQPGNLSCKEPVGAPPYCEIYCEDFEIYDAVPSRKYECVDESFASTLPRCAVVRKGSDELIRKRRKTEFKPEQLIPH